MRFLFSILLCLSCFAVHAWPTKPVRIVVAYPPGGGIDVMARQVADKVTSAWGQPVVVENKPGANTILATDSVAKSPADGHTILMTTDATFSINPHLYSKLPFDTRRDFIPVTMLVLLQQLLVAHPALPANTLQELISLAKQKPGSINYASYGSGSQPHLSGEMLKNKAGIDLVHVPYKGNAPATADLLAGRIQLLSSSIGGLQPGLDAGKTRLLLVATKSRLPYIPDVPTSAEAGIPDYLMTVWLGVVAPTGTPQPIVDRIHALVQGMLKDPVMVKRMAAAAIDVMPMSQREFAAFVNGEYGRWQKIVKDAGVEPQ